MRKMSDFKDKKIWITGGTKGIGRYMVNKFLDLGAIVITNCSGRNIDDIAKFKKETEGKNAKLMIADICKEEEIERVVSYIDEEYGKLDILINNAGISLDGYIEEYSVNVFRTVLDINVCGKFLCLQKSIRLLKKSDYPSVVNISSRLSVMPMEKSLGYCCSQGAIVMMTKVAILELSKYNIRINTVSPALTKTDLSLSFYTEEQLKNTKQKNPRNRLCECEDVFNTVRFLCSKEADYINGTNIHVNGGSVLV